MTDAASVETAEFGTRLLDTLSPDRREMAEDFMKTLAKQRADGLVACCVGDENGDFIFTIQWVDDDLSLGDERLVLGSRRWHEVMEYIFREPSEVPVAESVTREMVWVREHVVRRYRNTGIIRDLQARVHKLIEDELGGLA